MWPPKPVQLLLAVPAGCILLFAGLDVWYGSDANRLAGNANTADVCSVASLPRPVRDRCESGSRAAFAAGASAAMLALLMAAYVSVNWVTARVWSGRLSFLTGCRWGFRIALIASAVAWLIFAGVLYPMAFMLTFMRLLGLYLLELDNIMIGICLLGAVCGLAGLLRRDAASSMPESVGLTGTVATETGQRPLFLAIQQIAQAAKCDMPGNVVLGLDPGVICTSRQVHVEEAVLNGRTLYISLLYNRLFSESELMSLVTMALVPAQMVSEETAAWLAATGRHWARLRRRFQEAALPVIGIAMTLVWYWFDLWANWQANMNAFAIRRAAVVTGRENVAGALSKATAFSRRWGPFLRQVQGSLRRSEVRADELNFGRDVCYTHDGNGQRVGKRRYARPVDYCAESRC